MYDDGTTMILNSFERKRLYAALSWTMIWMVGNSVLGGDESPCSSGGVKEFAHGNGARGHRQPRTLHFIGMHQRGKHLALASADDMTWV